MHLIYYCMCCNIVRAFYERIRNSSSISALHRLHVYDYIYACNIMIELEWKKLYSSLKRLLGGGRGLFICLHFYIPPYIIAYICNWGVYSVVYSKHYIAWVFSINYIVPSHTLTHAARTDIHVYIVYTILICII